MPRTKCVLSPKSEAIVDKVIALLSIPENTQFYNQGSFMSPSIISHACTTECCLAGWMVFVAHPRKYKRLESAFVPRLMSNAAVEIEEMAGTLLTLADGSPVDTTNLFSGGGGNWPGQMGLDWLETNRYPDTEAEALRARKQQAKIAIRRLKYFKKHGQ